MKLIVLVISWILIGWRFHKILWPSQNIWTLNLDLICTIFWRAALVKLHIRRQGPLSENSFFKLFLNYFGNVVFWGPNHVPACKLSMILYYKAREPCMARVLSSTVQYVIACFTASYRIFSSWVHNTPRLQFKAKLSK